MYNIAVLCDRDSIYGFAALGLDIYPVEGAAEALETLKKLDGGSYAVIYITEQLASLLERELAKYDDCRIPAIIPIPGAVGNTGIGVANVKRAVERAVGSDIIFGGK